MCKKGDRLEFGIRVRGRLGLVGLGLGWELKLGLVVG